MCVCAEARVAVVVVVVVVVAVFVENQKRSAGNSRDLCVAQQAVVSYVSGISPQARAQQDHVS